MFETMTMQTTQSNEHEPGNTMYDNSDVPPLQSLSTATTPPTIAEAATTTMGANSISSSANNDSTSGATSGSSSKLLAADLFKKFKQNKIDLSQLSNDEIIEFMRSCNFPIYKLENILGKQNANKCVDIRRQYYAEKIDKTQQLLPVDTNAEDNNQMLIGHDDDRTNTGEKLAKLEGDKSLHYSDLADKNIKLLLPNRTDILHRSLTDEYDFSRVVGACGENVVGLVRVPVALVGPLILDQQSYMVPLATTEGCLAASTNRGLSLLAACGGVTSQVYRDAMTRAPIISFVDPELSDARKNVDNALEWLCHNKQKMAAAFNSTSKHLQFIDYTAEPAGCRDIHIRFEAHTGDAMGMNMCSKGAEAALREMQRHFSTMKIVTLSGNMCTDKKPSSINWVRGRGKSVQCNASLTAEYVEERLNIAIDKLHDIYTKKVLVGSAMAGSVGGFNCHAANIVAAIFIATGQDVAQVVSSSNCLLTLEKSARGTLEVNCRMPSIECGTVGGGTVLSDQSGYLQLMGISGPTPPKRQLNSNNNNSSSQASFINKESNSCLLARIVCATVLAAELSLLGSLAEGTLVKSHMTHNRSAQPCNVV